MPNKALHKCPVVWYDEAVTRTTYEKKMLPRHTTCNTSDGFTLIELSIVLVIIGLLIGAILVGRDLIVAAQLRAVVSQVEKFTSATNTFKSKYNCLPGDCMAVTAAAYAFAARAGTTNQGDGNGFIEGSATGLGGQGACSESLLFWNDLSTAGLIDGHYIGVDGSVAATSCNTGLAGADMSTILPAAKIEGNSFHVYQGNGYNYFQILKTPTFIQTRGQLINGGLGLSPINAASIDRKIDDGLPTSGLIISTDTSLTGSSFPGPGAATDPSITQSCGNSNFTPTIYNVNASTGGNKQLCTLQIRGGF
jgi:prepilin-type N-terminal cleavage/methylation domain-containing protein